MELLVVSVVMWFVVDYLYTRTATYLEPRGFDISHCYLIEMGKLTDKSPDYIPNQTDEQEDADILEPSSGDRGGEPFAKLISI